MDDELKQIDARIEEIERWRYQHIQLPYQEAREQAGCPVSVTYPQWVRDENYKLVAERRALSDRRSILLRQ